VIPHPRLGNYGTHSFTGNTVEPPNTTTCEAPQQKIIGYVKADSRAGWSNGLATSQTGAIKWYFAGSTVAESTKVPGLIGKRVEVCADIFPADTDSHGMPTLKNYTIKESLSQAQPGPGGVPPSEDTSKRETYRLIETDIWRLDSYIGDRVEITGFLVPGYETGKDGGPPMFQPTDIEPAVPEPEPPEPPDDPDVPDPSDPGCDPGAMQGANTRKKNTKNQFQSQYPPVSS
jgi:hypothetical protein